MVVALRGRTCRRCILYEGVCVCVCVCVCVEGNTQTIYTTNTKEFSHMTLCVTVFLCQYPRCRTNLPIVGAAIIVALVPASYNLCRVCRRRIEIGVRGHLYG